jgi:hypothetical protein
LRFLACSLIVLCGALIAACGPADPLSNSADPGSQRQGLFITDLRTATGSPVATGSTTGLTNDISPTCAYSAAPDAEYMWTAPYTGTFNFTTAGSSFDTVLVVQNPFNSSVLGCNDDSNGTLQSTVSLSLAAGTQVLVAIDGYASNTGSYKLNISSTPTCTPLSYATISGPSTELLHQSSSYTVNVSGGTPPFHYSWAMQFHSPSSGWSSWSTSTFDSPTTTASINSCGLDAFQLRVQVTDSCGASTYAYITVSISNPC